MSNNDLKIQQEYKDNQFTTLSISGLSVAEMNNILNRHDKGLEEVLTNHGMRDTYRFWKDGYGIYSYRHVGEHLFIEIGNSCD